MESKYSRLFHENKSVMLLVDEETNKIVDANVAACKFYGYKKEELIQKTSREIVSCPGLSRDDCRMGSITCILHPEIKHKLSNGEIRFVESHTGHIQVNGRKLLYCILHDVTKKREAEEKAAYLTYHDALTSLPNRIQLDLELREALKLASANQRSSAVLLLDIDRFKGINDALGHQFGDLLLAIMAERLKNIASKENYVARSTGDEFIILMPNVKGKEEAELFADKIIAEVQRPLNLKGQEIYVTASMGIALYPMDGTDAVTLIRNADIAMYKAKELGRNKYHFFDNDLKGDADSNFYLANDLRTALVNNELVVYYQPIMGSREDKLVGMESLLRWKHPTLGMIPPDKFIPIAEETGLIIPIGQWVLHTACNQCKAWVDMGYKHIKVSVNISAKQFHESDIYSMVVSELATTGLEPKHLEVEITESIAIRDIEKVKEVCRKLKDRGISIAMDDFGTGYSSLGYLSQLSLDTLKIDKTFIKDLDRNENNRAIPLAVIKMAHSLGLKITAEGVETKSHYDFLKENECDKIQGYLFGRPLPAEEFSSYFLCGAMQEAAVSILDNY